MTKKRVKDLPKTKRPRERMQSVGVENLTDAELLALLLGAGSKKHNVITLSKKLLKKYPLRKLYATELKELASMDGIGPVRAGKILASMELGRRAVEDIPLNAMLSPQDIIREVSDIREKRQEHLIALYLNARYVLIDKQTIGIGSINSMVIEPRDIFVHALSVPSPFIVLVHNHPSGDPTPSENDVKFTRRLVKAGELLGLSIVDHLIITKGSYISMKADNLL